MLLSMNDFLPGCLFAVVVNWSECVMSVLGHKNIPRAVSVLTLGNKVILYCKNKKQKYNNVESVPV